MTSLARQMEFHEASRVATVALEASARNAISTIFDAWEAEELTKVSVRYRLEAVIRNAYRSSAAISRATAIRSADLEGWEPAVVFNTDYLQSLLQDVRANLRDYKADVLTRKQAISRIEHSAGVAAHRGHTDQTISAYKELEEFGFQVSKYWVANFVDNVPCPSCTRLHGTSVPLGASFQAETGEPGVYMDLIGPPRHPRCKCRLFVFIASLENAFEKPNFVVPQDSPTLISTTDIQKLSSKVFASVKSTLSAILMFLRRK